MPYQFLFGADRGMLSRIEGLVREMFQHDRREFELAMSALLGDLPADVVGRDIRELDRKVNALEREIRRALVVHASVHAHVDTPSLLIYMSIVKDVERLGDYAKNLVDLARDGARFDTLDDAAEWRQLVASLLTLIDRVGEAFLSQGDEDARVLLAPANQLLQRFNLHVSALVRGDDTGPQPVARALAYRYLKRVVAHLLNVLSAVVMPIDKLDFFDEDPDDRAPR